MIDYRCRRNAIGLSLLMAVSLLACTSCGSETDSTAAGPVSPIEGKWTCGGDGDCINSCSQGAVSKAWYDKQAGTLIECLDGCNNQISGPPRCIDGQCVAFDDKGARREHCTRKGASR